MSRYNNQNSKRKQKRAAKRAAHELCTYHMSNTDHGTTDAIYCVTPEEFLRLEAEVKHIPVEVTRIKRKRVHFEPRQLSATA